MSQKTIKWLCACIAVTTFALGVCAGDALLRIRAEKQLMQTLEQIDGIEMALSPHTWSA